MNSQAWEALEQSARFGVELHNQTYTNLRNAAAEVISAAGFSDDDVRKGASELNQLEQNEAAHVAAEKLATQERQASERNQDKQHQFLIAATLYSLPKYDYKTERFDVQDQATLQALADTVVWVKAPNVNGNMLVKYEGFSQKRREIPQYDYYPFYILGYKYSDNSALLAAALPADASNYSRRSYDQCRLHSMRTLDTMDNYGRGSIGVTVPVLFVYTPEKKDQKHFQTFMQQDIHLIAPEQRAAHYDRESDSYALQQHSPLVYRADYGPSDESIRAQERASRSIRAVNSAHGGRTSDRFPLKTIDTLQDYNALDLGIVRLMAHFDKGDEYLALLQSAKFNYIGNIAASQQIAFVEQAKTKA